MAEHVEALGTMVHGVGHDMGEDAAGGEGVGLIAAISVDDGVEWNRKGSLFEGVCGWVVEFDDLVECVGLFFEAWTAGGLFEDIGPAVHGTQVVNEVVVERSGSHLEGLCELLWGE